MWLWLNQVVWLVFNLSFKVFTVNVKGLDLFIVAHFKTDILQVSKVIQNL